MRRRCSTEFRIDADDASARDSLRGKGREGEGGGGGEFSSWRVSESERSMVVGSQSCIACPETIVHFLGVGVFVSSMEVEARVVA